MPITKVRDLEARALAELEVERDQKVVERIKEMKVSMAVKTQQSERMLKAYEEFLDCDINKVTLKGDY